MRTPDLLVAKAPPAWPVEVRQRLARCMRCIATHGRCRRGHTRGTRLAAVQTAFSQPAAYVTVDRVQRARLMQIHDAGERPGEQHRVLGWSSRPVDLRSGWPTRSVEF
jgi:hypothetical protein